MEFIDLYEVLGIGKDALESEIKKAYHKQAWKLHPDLNPGDADAIAKFQQLNEAYSVLSKRESRDKYDKFGKNWEQITVIFQQYRQNQDSNINQETYGHFVDIDLFAFFCAMFGLSTNQQTISTTQNQSKMHKKIMLQCVTSAPVEKVWKYFSKPKHVMNWNFASNDWCCSHAENDLKIKGKFTCIISEKQGAKQFQYQGTYTDIIPEKLIKYVLQDGRTVTVVFSKQGHETEIIQTIEIETNISKKNQQFGWQTILNNFKAYCESTSTSP